MTQIEMTQKTGEIKEGKEEGGRGKKTGNTHKS